MNKEAKIYVAGHKGLVGSALVRALQTQGYHNLLLRTHAEMDLTDQQAVQHFFAVEQPDYVFLAAAKVGGIEANRMYPAQFIYNNLIIQTNVIHESWRQKVKKLLFLGSSCIYPRDCLQPIKEEYLLTGTLESTNEAYALAKIAGIKMCEAYNRQYGTNYMCVMPTNLYGPGDNYDLQTSHVLPALIRKFHEALPDQPVVVWGTGMPRREFLHSDDMAAACVFLMEQCDKPQMVNIGTGEDLTIRDLAYLIQSVVGHTGEIIWDAAKPDGTPRKLLDVSRLHALGWQHKIKLPEGIAKVYEQLIQSDRFD
ncbi:GDP-L-fucose synthase [Sporomusa termitida]|uniref:GDP-L-fucose synthase n=2 Tax=Sporomusa termitida TaxID=2377 RepID=A0A517DXG1_9FIRM|nr:GDP-L-fucose synthase [Sporomusa termitida]